MRSGFRLVKDGSAQALQHLRRAIFSHRAHGGTEAIVRISHRYRFIFFAFPKTGSESVRRVLDPISDVTGANPFHDEPVRPETIGHNHIAPVDLRAIFRERGWPFDDYFRFVFVRNPWARLVSVYRMIRREEPDYPMPFGEWLLATRPSGDGGNIAGKLDRQYRRYGTYSLDSFACDEAGTRLVDAVFRLEDMATVPPRLRERGIPLSIAAMPKLNSSGEADLSTYYTPALRAVVALRYAKDIEEFGYSFPG